MGLVPFKEEERPDVAPHLPRMWCPAPPQDSAGNPHQQEEPHQMWPPTLGFLSLRNYENIFLINYSVSGILLQGTENGLRDMPVRMVARKWMIQLLSACCFLEVGDTGLSDLH